MQEQIKHHHHKNQIKDKHSKYLRTNNTNYTEHLNNKTNKTTLKLYKENIHHEAKITELGEFPNSTDYEAMWDIAIDKWTRNWNFYREKLTESILSQLNIHHKQQKKSKKHRVNRTNRTERKGFRNRTTRYLFRTL